MKKEKAKAALKAKADEKASMEKEAVDVETTKKSKNGSVYPSQYKMATAYISDNGLRNRVFIDNRGAGFEEWWRWWSCRRGRGRQISFYTFFFYIADKRGVRAWDWECPFFGLSTLFDVHLHSQCFVRDSYTHVHTMCAIFEIVNSGMKRRDSPHVNLRLIIVVRWMLEIEMNGVKGPVFLLYTMRRVYV